MEDYVAQIGLPNACIYSVLLQDEKFIILFYHMEQSCTSGDIHEASSLT